MDPPLWDGANVQTGEGVSYPYKRPGEICKALGNCPATFYKYAPGRSGSPWSAKTQLLRFLIK